MSEYTKGPLVVRHGIDGDYHVDAPDGHAGFATCWGKDDVAKANAHLYAAAPELLEALKSAEAFEASLIGEWDDFWDVAPQLLIDKLMEAQELRNSAIAKAEAK